MTNDPPAADGLERRVAELVAGLDPADIPALLNAVGRFGSDEVFTRPARPKLRKERRDKTSVYRIRADLAGAKPPIWRRLDIRSDASLLDLHRILQAAFGWLDYHLYRFALGGSPFGGTSELFLCDYDVTDGEDEGTPVAEVRLDETMQAPGDKLAYVYDYGDSWEVTLRLEYVRDAEAATPIAHCVDGRRAAPPEDSGGMVDAASLAEVVDDPAHFDLDEVNAALDDPVVALFDAEIDPLLPSLLLQSQQSEFGPELTERAGRLLSASPAVPADRLRSDLQPYLWFLQRARDGGLPLTSAGYLKPVDVTAASAVLPTMRDWIGTKNREITSTPLLEFRESLQTRGLLRKYKGALLPTRLGKTLLDDPAELATYLGQCLLADEPDEFSGAARLLLLLFAATSENGSLPLAEVATVLADLGWSRANGSPVKDRDLYSLDGAPHEVLREISEPGEQRHEWQLSPTAIAISQSALTGRPVETI